MYSIKLFLTDGSHVISTELDVYMQNMYDDGDWGSKDTCPAGSYAAGVQLEVSAQRTLYYNYYYFVK